MGQLVTQFIFKSEKGEIIAQTSDMAEMASIKKGCEGEPFNVNKEYTLYFNGNFSEYKVLDIEIYPYQFYHDADDSVQKYSCETIIYLQLV